ncbi:MAG: hypothetical protein J6Q22_17965 [Prevotella sp.]|nr:hypothetical protein [Prevotella sp.]
MKANDLFESYLHTICPAPAQFEAINKLHKLYFEAQMDAEVEIEDECKDGECKDGECKDGECKGGKCKDGKCECEKGLNESVGEENISAEAEKNGLSVPEYMEAKEMFDSIL